MRTLSFQAREERRRQVVGLRRRGWTYEAVAEQTGLSCTGVFNICQRYAQEGACALKDKRGGRKVGDSRALSAEQEAEIRRLICDKTPDQLTDMATATPEHECRRVRSLSLSPSPRGGERRESLSRLSR